MSGSINIGVDFGSTGLRVAYTAAGEQPVMLPADAIGHWPWLLCEPAAQSRLGIAFPSLKSKLGTAATVSVNRRATAPAELIAEVFRAVQRAVEAKVSKSVIQAVVTVPARYSASQRVALREAALAAGLSEVHLINDTLGAVIAHTAQQKKGATLLVYSMGYAGFELGLVRAVRGHYRALGYEGGSSPAGWVHDQPLLEALFAASEEKSLPLDGRHWNAAMWMQVRAVAQRVKEELTTKDQVDFPVAIRTADGRAQATVAVARSAFEGAVDPSFRTTLEHAASLLDQANMTAADVDKVLLVGGSTRIPILRRRVEKTLGRKPVVAQPDDLARGAALYAAQLQSNSPPADPEQERVAADVAEVGISQGVRAAVTLAEGVELPSTGDQLIILAGGERTPESVAEGDDLRHARQLIEQGRSEQARARLQKLIQEAQALLKAIPPAAMAQSPSSHDFFARRAIARGHQLLKKGQYEEAVRESHLAWQEDRNSPDVFEQMIDIHCRAAQASTAPEDYADAQRWLMCAYSHDESNTRIWQLIAERHYLHAKHLSERGKRKEALETIKHCLAWDPEHTEARALRDRVTRR